MPSVSHRKSAARLPLVRLGRAGASVVADTDALTASNEYVEAELTKRLKSIEDCVSADVIVCIHPIMEPFDDIIRNSIEDVPKKKDDLLVILETDGGSIEITERIADVFRHHYSGEVSFLVPNRAMSAGTILVMSGDRIFMDYYSVLGPIDPQIRGRDGYVPGLGYLEKYKQLIAKSGRRGGLTQAELAFLLDKFDPAQLHRLEQAREHSVDLLKKWLVEYKFKNWNRTKTQGRKVTLKMKTDRAKEIAKKLNDTRLWRSHGRGISIDVVKNTLNLVVDDFGSEPELAGLNKYFRNYYRLLQDYMERRSQSFVVHTHSSFLAY